ncbi:response regulator [Vibrio alginolyticus]|uniref:ATP-binding protein n=1 Tax=Vibrio alginolyticus TaxID=663 RepID=UPI001BD5899B|nr:ATP-binding protein [Vibrio alginolyticus]EGQ9766093.1 response regulator [Vibrio alginolyticus]EHA1075032.1 response regulator [Vibrio alginolyticus]EHA1133441.1 response regulator [Vibrio alginolyticus]MBS9839688.1 response regulator [Vibrio alginolyticus]
MNKFKLINFCFFIGILACCTLAYMSYMNSKNAQEFHAELMNIGHELIEERDVIVNRYAVEDRKNYELTTSLVEIEIAAQALLESSKASVWFPVTPNRIKVRDTLEQFKERVLQITLKLDMLIGVQVENRYALLMLFNLYQQEVSIDSGQSLGGSRYFEFLNQLLLTQTEVESEKEANFLKRLQTSDKRIELLTNELLDHTYIEFVESSEHRLLNIAQSEARFTWLFVFIAVMFLVSAFVYPSHHRMHNLKQLNLEIEEARNKAERAAKAKSNFLAAMSHELRTPMNGVLGLSQMIAEETKEPTTKEHIRVILDSGQHLMTILNDILDFSKVEENKLEFEQAKFKLDQVLSPVCSAIKPLVDEKNIELILENEVSEYTEFTGDCARLRQILFNLAGNAVKFTNEGHVLVRTELDESNQLLVMRVSDTGIGIAPDKHEHIFNSFEQADSSTTRRFGGTGLGLAIVKKLTDLMGGHITLKSIEGVGSQFIVELPIPWVESAPKKQQEAPKPRAKSHHLKILLADDNRVNAIVAKGFCEKLGHEVDVAENGLIAVKKAKENEYDLILMDNHMPEMNGVEATRVIRQELGIKTLLFAYTADVFREAHDSFIEAGADHVLTKPLQHESFSDALKQFAARLEPKQNPPLTSDSNVLQLQRKPIENLRLTEEELSRSGMFASLRDEPEALDELLKSIIVDFETSVDELIEYFMAEDFASLALTLHKTKGMALNLSLPILASQTEALETQLKANQSPEIEQLQMLINRLQVNIHQSHRLLDDIQKNNADPQQIL